ncbi:LLM class flavin-dependent oxidoreductase [Fervidibacillus halotolerans]|uniref:LLM class flavin-dependent oxidoreductase n=1 Tax=Fervidibacillus halotolerans TaxID=2980027 RepID=A0A9E8RWI0_9BACI|nr:LLM class flavin-dependent oxidoreductase [Fervidibacillus halotolerans]WAA11775.1 LLM class flavin-dependent oxidoreductase [Fervidibacillus halotolerans]
MSLSLSILDQSPISEGKTARDALNETVELAVRADMWGYKRFWVSEHHDSDSLAGSSPEVLAAYLIAKTKKIRIGSGGVMLSHYSPYKVAENFRVLESLAPGRIDLGIGRAPGGMPRSTIALNDSRSRGLDKYPKKVDELLQYLHDDLPQEHPLYGLKASPITETKPDVWMLGSSEEGAKLAAKMGLPYAFAHFINGEGGDKIMESYLNHFQPSSYYKRPKNIVAVFAICAETDQEAERIASSLDYSLLMVGYHNETKGTPSPEKALSYPYRPYELARIRENRKRMIIGSPRKVKEELYRLSERYRTNEVMLVSITFDFKDKLKSFELIAKELLS